MQEDATTGTPGQTEQTPPVEQPAQASQAPLQGLPAEPQDVATAPAEPTYSPTNNQATPQDVQLDEDIDDWAAKKGISVTTENERRLAQIARDNQREFTRDRQAESQQMTQALNPQATDQLYDDPTLSMLDRFNQRLARAENRELQNDFFQEFPDAKESEAAIAEKLTDPVNQELIRAGYAEKALRGAYAEVLLEQRNNQTEALKQQGAQEALEGLAARQRVATPMPSATRSTSGQRITPDNVDEVYANATPEQLSDPMFQQQVSEAMR